MRNGADEAGHRAAASAATRLVRGAEDRSACGVGKLQTRHATRSGRGLEDWGRGVPVRSQKSERRNGGVGGGGSRPGEESSG